MYSGGFSKPRLDRLHGMMARHVANGSVPGIVMLVSRHGETHVGAHGSLTAGGPMPMRRDSIFRIASAGKPMTAAVAMMLVEDGKLRLDEPVDPFLPELANRKVLKSLSSPLSETVPASRPITLRDLLTLRMGQGAVMVWPPQYPIQQAQADAGIAPGPDMWQGSPDDYMKRLGSLPLIHQPGEGWLYHTGLDVTGVLLERASGKTFAALMQERLFAPLGMKDTAFFVPPDKIDRLVTFYRGGADGKLVVHDESRGGRWSKPPQFASGGGGLVSTVDDGLAFGRLLLAKGKHGNERLLSRASIDLMTTDHVTARQKADWPFYPGFWDSWGWGLGCAVVTARSDLAMTPGRFGWDGGYGTSLYVDPAEDLVGVLFTQRMMDSPAAPPVYQDFWTGTYQALGD